MSGDEKTKKKQQPIRLNETVQNRKQPDGLDYLPHRGNGLLPDHRTDCQLLGLSRVHHHRLQAGSGTPARRTLFHVSGQPVLAVCLRRFRGGQDGELHERADERRLHPVPLLDHHTPGAQIGGVRRKQYLQRTDSSHHGQRTGRSTGLHARRCSPPWYSGSS